MKQDPHPPSTAAAPSGLSRPSTAWRCQRRTLLASLAATALGTPAFAQPVNLEQRSRHTAAVDQRFSQYIGSRMPHTAYSFGAWASVPWAENGFAIRNLAELQQHFNPLEDFTGATTINDELQVYASTFNPTDHRIAEDRIGLWANLPGGAWTVRTGSQSNPLLGWPLDGSPIAWNRIPTQLLPYVQEWRVGQLVALQYRGIYHVSELQPGVSFRLARLGDSPGSGEFLFNVAAFLPIDSATSIAAHGNATTVLRFAPGSLSPAIRVGHRVAATAPNALVRNAADTYVTAIDHAAGIVTVNRPLPINTVAAGRRYLFYPRITAGQAWTRRQWDITHPSAFLAVEFDIALFEGLSPAFDSAGVGSATALARVDAAHPDAPFGAWPALWAYSADDGDPTKFRGTSEMDFMELWVSTTSGMKLFSSSNIGGTVGWTKSAPGYSVTNDGRNRVPQSLAGSHKVAVVYAGQKTYHYLDDVLVRIEQFRWASQAPIQIGMNMAMGSIHRAFAANLNFPLRPSNFERSHMDVKSLRVWHRAQ